MGEIRLANESDIAAILEIYTPYVLSSAISFEYTPPSLSDFTTRYLDSCAAYPWLVVEKNGQVAGYAFGSRSFVRAAYQWNASLSVYIAKEYVGQKLGSALFERLLDILTAQGYYAVYSVVVLPNPSSVALNKRFGFSQIALFKEVGYKLGKWHDVVWFEKQLAQRQVPPKPLLDVAALPLALQEPVSIDE